MWPNGDAVCSGLWSFAGRSGMQRLLKYESKASCSHVLAACALSTAAAYSFGLSHSSRRQSQYCCCLARTAVSAEVTANNEFGMGLKISQSASAERINPSDEQQHLAWPIKDVPSRFTGGSVPGGVSLNAVVARGRRGTKPRKLRMCARQVHGTRHCRMGMTTFHLRVVLQTWGLSDCCCSPLDCPR